MTQNEPKFDQWCIVELFGHSRIAGRCSEQNIAGTNMLRVDVPETKRQPAFTKYYGSAAIYAINPVDESTVRIAAEKIEMAPVIAWQAESFIKKVEEMRSALPPAVQDHEYDEDDL